MTVAVVLEQCWHRVPGGTATAALSSVRALQAHTDVELVGVSARHRHPPGPSFVPPLRMRSLPLPRAALYEAWHGLRWPPVQRATGPVALIHATGLAVPPRTAPLVVTLNDLAFVHEPGHFTRRGLRFFHRSLELTRREADVVVVPSEATRRDVEGHGIDAARVLVVPYGIDVPVAEESAVETVRGRHGLDRPYVVWVGTVEPRKNLRTVVAAHRRLRDGGGDLDLVLVGPGGWHEDLEAVLGDELGARREGVHVLGFVPDIELRALLRGATVCCYPSLREGFGLPVLEAMAQGTPVVTSAGTSTEEVLGPDGAAGRAVAPLDAAAVADALAELAAPARRPAASVAARERAATFSWQRTADGLLAAYRQAEESAS